MKFVLRNDRLLARAEATVDIDDRGYQFGDGVYEVIRMYGGIPFLMTEHLNRLRRSARELGFELNFDGGDLENRLRKLVEKEGVALGSIYLQVTRGVHPRIQEFPPAETPVQLTAYVRALPRPEDKIANGVRAALVPDIRWLRCDIKSLNLIPNILARQRAKESECYEALQHRGDVVTEGSFSNAYMVSGETVFTHPAGNLILSGITRAHVLSLCAQNGIPAREEAFTVEDLLAADEAFITSTTNEVMPVTHVDGRAIGEGKPGVTTQRIQKHYEESFMATSGSEAF